jgi:hypothetical protein
VKNLENLQTENRKTALEIGAPPIIAGPLASSSVPRPVGWGTPQIQGFQDGRSTGIAGLSLVFRSASRGRLLGRNRISTLELSEE